MSTPIPCFVLEPTGQVRRSLRRYASSNAARSKCSGPFSYHNAKVEIDTVADDPNDAIGDLWPHDDPRWPARCSCGYEFQPDDEWQLFREPMYRRTDTGETMPHRDFPAGAMYFAPWLENVKPYKSRSPDGRVLFVRTPGGDWCIDAEASGGGGWTRTGVPPLVTASPSIIIGGYHGWLRAGVLVPCLG